MKFILSRVVIVTLLAGLASFVLLMVFKLLVMLLATALIVMAAKTLVRSRHYGRGMYSGPGSDEPYIRNKGVVPVQQDWSFNSAQEVRPAIVPVN